MVATLLTGVSGGRVDPPAVDLEPSVLGKALGLSHAGPDGLPFLQSGAIVNESSDGMAHDVLVIPGHASEHLSGHAGAGSEGNKDVLGAGLAPIRASHESSDLAPAVPEGIDVISYATPKGEDGTDLVPGASYVSSTTACASPTAEPLRVLVAKALTNSDAGSGRIILPRVAVETRLPFVTPYRHFALDVRCARTGAVHSFVVKSWANGSEHRRVFVLEGAADYLRLHGLGVGDVVGICAPAGYAGDGSPLPEGGLIVAANTPELRAASSAGGSRGGDGAVRAQAAARQAAAVAYGVAGTGTQGLVLNNVGGCTRSAHCTKSAGHPGFCSGPKAAQQQHATRLLSRMPSQTLVRRAMMDASVRDSSDEAASGWGAQDAHAPTRRSRRASARRRHRGEDEEDLADEYEDYDERQTRTRRQETDWATIDVEEWGMPGAPARPATGVATPFPRRALRKELTAYDVSASRVVLDAASVAAALGLGAGGGGVATVSSSLWTLPCVDESGCWHLFRLRAWCSLAGRTGYVLDGEPMVEFLKARGAQMGDRLLFWRAGPGLPPRVRLARRTEGDDTVIVPTIGAVLESSNKIDEREDHSSSSSSSSSTVRFEDWPALLEGSYLMHLAAPLDEEDEDDENEQYDEDDVHYSGPSSLSGRHYSKHGRGTTTNNHANIHAPAACERCQRTAGCIKQAGHQGFCSGHKGFRRRNADQATGGGSSLARGHGNANNGGGYGRKRSHSRGDDSDDSDFVPASKRRVTSRRAVAVSHAEASGDPLLSLLSLLN